MANSLLLCLRENMDERDRVRKIHDRLYTDVRYQSLIAEAQKKILTSIEHMRAEVL